MSYCSRCKCQLSTLAVIAAHNRACANTGERSYTLVQVDLPVFTHTKSGRVYDAEGFLDVPATRENFAAQREGARAIGVRGI